MTVLVELQHIVALAAVLACAPMICWLDSKGLLGQPEKMDYLEKRGYFNVYHE